SKRLRATSRSRAWRVRRASTFSSTSFPSRFHGSSARSWCGAAISPADATCSRASSRGRSKATISRSPTRRVPRRCWRRSSRSAIRASSTSPTATSRRSRPPTSKSRGRAPRTSWHYSPAAVPRSRTTWTRACSRRCGATAISPRWRRSTSASGERSDAQRHTSGHGGHMRGGLLAGGHARANGRRILPRQIDHHAGRPRRPRRVRHPPPPFSPGHWRRHFRGNPAIIAKNMRAAAGLAAASTLYTTADKDGSTIAAFTNGAAMEPLFGNTSARYDAQKFNWLGSIGKLQNVCATWHQSPVKTIDAARAREVIVAAAGATSNTAIVPKALNALIGTKFKVIAGYDTGAGLTLSIERGEAEGICGLSWSTIKASRPHWIRDKLLNIIVQMGLQKLSDLPDVPSALDLVTDPENRP